MTILNAGSMSVVTEMLPCLREMGAAARRMLQFMPAGNSLVTHSQYEMNDAPMVSRLRWRGARRIRGGQRQRSPPRWPLPFGMLAGGLAGFISETDAGGGFGHMGRAADAAGHEAGPGQ